MRMFYEEWAPVLELSDAASSISPIMIGEIETSTLLSSKSPITTDDLELFGNLSFTHHVRILNGEKDVDKRWKYIRLAIENKWDTRYLKQQIKDNAAKVCLHNLKLMQSTMFTILRKYFTMTLPQPNGALSSLPYASA